MAFSGFDPIPQDDPADLAIRDRIAEATSGIRTQVQLDGFVGKGGLRELLAEFPGRELITISEWNTRKLSIRHVTGEDD